jgi:hypothetical protein
MTKEEVKSDIQKFSAIEAVSNTAGGKIIITSLERDLTSVIDELSSKYKTATRDELVSICASLSAKLALLRAFKKAKKLKKLAQEELKFLLDEE